MAPFPAATLSRRVSLSPSLSSVLGSMLVFSLFGCTTGEAMKNGEYSVHVKSVTIDSRTASPVMLLEETEGEHRRLPIWIGSFEAQSIALAMEEVRVPRPNTHDLIKNLMDEMHARVQRVVITELKDSTYYAIIDLTVDGEHLSVDSRPSDAIAVAIRTGSPVYASGSVLDRNSDDTDEEGDALRIIWKPQLEREHTEEIESY